LELELLELLAMEGLSAEEECEATAGVTGIITVSLEGSLCAGSGRWE